MFQDYALFGCVSSCRKDSDLSRKMLATSAKGSTLCCRQQAAAPPGQPTYPHATQAAACRPQRAPWAAGGACGRRALLTATAGAALLQLLRAPGADASMQLKSVRSAVPSVLTFQNELDRVVKVYWINYSGDAEFYAAIPPSGWWTVDSFESHPWRVVDAQSGEVLQEVVSPRGPSLVRIDPLQAQATQQSSRAHPASQLEPEFVGWDGIGGSEDEYVPATIAEIGLDHLGGVALISAEGFPLPVPVAVGINDAAQLFHAAGPEFRRPSTMATWVGSLRAVGASVDRVLITRLVGTTVYARIILALPGGERRSLDSRPSDSLALAMQTGAPIYIGRRLAASQQPGALELDVIEWHEQRPPTPNMQGSPPVAAQASYGHMRKA